MVILTLFYLNGKLNSDAWRVKIFTLMVVGLSGCGGCFEKFGIFFAYYRRFAIFAIPFSRGKRTCKEIFSLISDNEECL